MAVALLAGALWLARRGASPAPDPLAARAEAVREAAQASPPPAPPDAPVASLRDTEVDGHLALDGDRFRPDRAALRLFDYYLSASGEEPETSLRARIVAEIERRLPPAAAREALAFLDRYLAYRADARRMAADDRLAESADLERRLQWVRELRRKHFGAELAAQLFGDEERAVALAIERRRIAGDASLSPGERRARLEAFAREHPESALDAATIALRLREREAALRAAGAGDAELRALREEAVGPEAAERLAALDARRAEWRRRLDAYRAERDALRTDPALDDGERSARLEALRAERFDPIEQLRVRSLDEAEVTPDAD
jgi:lipase chaperone LimK